MHEDLARRLDAFRKKRDHLSLEESLEMKALQGQLAEAALWNDDSRRRRKGEKKKKEMV